MVTHFKRQLWISLSIIFGSILIVVVALYYLSGALAAQADKIASDRSMIDQQADALEVLSNLKNQQPQAAKYQAAMDQLLPTQDGLIDFGQWIDNLATANQVTADVSFQGGVEQATANSPGQANFSMTASGSLNDLAAFLSDIESKAPGFFLEIQSINLVDNNQSYNLNGQGYVFFRP